MKNFFLLASFLASFIFSPNTAGDSVASISRVVGGISAQSRAWPFVVSLQKRASFSFNWSHTCGGTLVHSQWVLTAAHCVENLGSLSLLRVNIGINDLYSDTPEIHSISKLLIHPSFNTHTLDSDLALLKLDQSVAQVPVGLIDNTALQNAGTLATLVGWGSTSEGGAISRKLQQVEVPVLAQTTCNAFQVYNGDVSSNMLCAGYLQEEKDACNGDSGGPLLVYNNSTFKQIGIVSWGQGCARPNKPGVYTRVQPFLNWIQSSIGDSNAQGGSTPTQPPATEPAPPSESSALTLTDALDYAESAFKTGGSLPWSAQAITSFDGQSAARSGDIRNTQNSWISNSFDGPGVVSFYWKVSSEPRYDEFSLYLDRNRLDRISGEVDWQRKELVIPPGSKTITWIYQKDRSRSYGQDQAYLDQVSFSKGSLTPSTDIINFGDVVLNSGPVSKTLQLTNQSTEASIMPGSIKLRRFYRSPFSLTKNSCSSSLITPGNSCEIEVVYQPVAEGEQKAYLIATIDPSTNYQEIISVTANAITTPLSSDTPTTTPDQGQGYLSASPEVIDFGPTPIGAPSPVKILSISNPGSSVLTLDLLKILDNEQNEIIIESDSCSLTILEPLASCSVSLSFKPKYVDSIQTSLLINTTTTGVTLRVDLKGVGIALEDLFQSQGITFEHGGDLPFESAYDEESGEYSLKSPPIGNSQASWFQFNVTGPALIGFDLKTSTEELVDRFQFSVDSILRFSLSGETPWTPQRALLSQGDHILRFEYKKNELSTAGTDQILLKNFSKISLGTHLRPGWNQLLCREPRPVPVKLYLDAKNFSTRNQPFTIIWGWNAEKKRYETYIPDSESRQTQQELVRAYTKLEFIEPSKSYWIYMLESSVFYFE